MSAPPAPLQHRADIDGLRALAIIPVVLFHYRLGYAPGGFVGVDIFFVISGYLITGLLLQDIERGRFSLLRFYERRARRILPALFAMLALVGLAALYVLLPVDLANFGRSLVATTAFVSNFYYWSQSSYFARAAEFNALLHTWSLAVEEQFYILFPLCLFALATLGSRWRNRALLLAALASLAASAYLSTAHASLAFYWPITRIWELMLGALLAAVALPALRAPRSRDVLSLLGLALALAGILIINPGWAFPGWIALLPCAGAGLLIYTGSCGGGLGNTVLALRPLAFVGLISYSLYLWHWPVLVLAQNLVPHELTRAQLLAALALACSAAVLSWRYVERPFRGSTSAFSRAQVFELAGAASVAAIVLGVALAARHGLPGRFPQLAAVARAAQLESPIFPQCFAPGSAAVRAGRLCAIGAEHAPPSFVLWGDSHAQRMALPVAQVAAAHGRSGWLASAGACPPLLDVEWPVPDCRAFNAAVAALIDADNSGVREVIISGLWADYTEGTMYRAAQVRGALNVLSDADSGAASVAENRRTFTRSLLRTVEHFTRAGRRVILIGPVPEVSQPVPETLFRARRFGGTTDFGPSLAEFRSRQDAALAALEQAAQLPLVTVVYPSEVLCRERCAVERDGLPLYVDDNHLSYPGLALMKPLLQQAFEPAPQ